ncbi:MAG: 2'-5' RNA ligase family protein [Nocardioides sp.]|uniref:2'-5' RNA ligase family protein n=1 Tax=Nocardioides sp. TaxID=35761 RepID=UPI003F07FB6A
MPTIGVAVAIPEPWASGLQEYRTDLGDLTALLIPTHVTLIPPTEISEEQFSEIEEHLAAVAASRSSFRVHLRGTGTFRPVSPVVFIAVAEGIAGFEQLADAVRTGPLAVELDFPYHPHVTVAHNLADDLLDRAYDELAEFECVFDADAFHLYRHDETLGWQATRAFELE